MDLWLTPPVAAVFVSLVAAASELLRVVVVEMVSGSCQVA